LIRSGEGEEALAHGGHHVGPADGVELTWRLKGFTPEFRIDPQPVVAILP
jgi:hypothetical protein